MDADRPHTTNACVGKSKFADIIAVIYLATQAPSYCLIGEFRECSIMFICLFLWRGLCASFTKSGVMLCLNSLQETSSLEFQYWNVVRTDLSSGVVTWSRD